STYPRTLSSSLFPYTTLFRSNSIVVIDADGEILGLYRKSHIPDGPGYEEKFYFNPGDTGFKVWDTKYAKIGVGICWDQWYPEAADRKSTRLNSSHVKISYAVF